jgi:hypothetical protein
MKYILLTFLLILSGCASVKEPAPVVIKENKEKDLYIEKVESVVSDAASGVLAVSEAMDKASIQYKVLESQAVRLGGIKPASVVKLNEFRATIANNDTKAAAKDKAVAVKVDEETSLLWAEVTILDSELTEAKARKLEAEAAAARAIKDNVINRITMLGMGLIICGVVTIAFTPKKLAGLVVVGSGIACASSAWIFDNPIYQYILLGLAGFIALDLIILIYRKTFGKKTCNEASN